jgi:thiamine biosynthesis lipoprotein
MLRRCRPLLGTFVEMMADDEAAIEAAFAAIGRVHRLMSAHEAGSDVSRVNRFAHLGPVEVDDWTMLVIERALFWSRHSRGAFDVVCAGKAALASGHLPRHADQPVADAGHWTWLEIQGRAVRLLKPGCIDLGGIAKGFAVDQAVAAMRSAGALRGLVNAGGDLAAFGPEPWPIEIVDPLRRRALCEVQLLDEALATSAVQPDGDSAHLPERDPRFVSASVRAATAMDADSLAKIILSASPTAESCLARAGAEGLRLTADGSVEAVELLAA